LVHTVDIAASDPPHTRRSSMTIEAPKVHVHMTVSNLEKSRAFYEKFFGTAR